MNKEQVRLTEKALAELLGWTDLTISDDNAPQWTGIPPGKGADERPLPARPVPKWMTDDASAFELMAAHLDGYYETRLGDPEHCIVIGNRSAKTTVVYLRDFADKRSALRAAIVAAVTAEARVTQRRRAATA